MTQVSVANECSLRASSSFLLTNTTEDLKLEEYSNRKNLYMWGLADPG